ncbi:MarR family winged helix-turn-helix transcriptional regulator [Nocardia sp. NPDC058176]|uniref:MarR family winged helix-turn-helix transcriptional regulator n=1 Tax=Nocardia sp. NPDC058176 TaxID=3346368 RepID=UPI0036DA4D4E
MTETPRRPARDFPQATEQEWALWTSFFPMEAELWQWLSRSLRADTGLSEADWQVLEILGNTPGHSLRAFHLAERIKFSKSRLHQHAARMTTRGFLEQHPAPEDGRGTIITLTSVGLSTFRDAQIHRARHIREALIEALTPDEVDTLIDLSTKIRRTVRELGTT